MNRDSVAWTPAMVFRVTWKTHARNTRNTLNGTPMPNHRMNIGTKASSGVAYSTLSHGTATYDARLNQPAARPTLTPTIAAAVKPSAHTVSVAEMSVQIVPR